jgi:hypothetical protein
MDPSTARATIDDVQEFGVNRFFAAAIIAVLISTTVACRADHKDSEPSPTPSATARTEVTLPPDPTATPSVSVAPTVTAGELKLRVVEVATGAVLDLPVSFGRANAWSRDSSQQAVAGDGLAVGDADGSPFSLFWKAQCYAVEWSPTQDIVAAACGDGLVVLDAGGKVLARDDVSPNDWTGRSPYVHWSPDGHTLAYGPMNAPISILRNDGTRSQVGGTFARVQWLSDGRLASIEQADYRAATTVRIHDPAKGYSVVEQLTVPAGANGLGIDPTGKYVGFAGYGASPPVGTRILPSVFSLLRIADGQAVATFAAYDSNYNPASFSPDGQSVLLQTDLCGPSWSLRVGKLDGSSRVIARGAFMATKFSPDGTQVGFTRGTELWTVDSDGGTPPRRLAENVHGPFGFDWSPDSKWISVPPFFGGFDQCP